MLDQMTVRVYTRAKKFDLVYQFLRSQIPTRELVSLELSFERLV